MRLRLDYVANVRYVLQLRVKDPWHENSVTFWLALLCFFENVSRDNRGPYSRTDRVSNAPEYREKTSEGR